MPAPRHKPPEDRRVEPQGPLGNLLSQALEPRPGLWRRRLSRDAAAQLINKAAWELSRERPSYSRWSLRNWIGRGVTPREDALPWIAEALHIPLDQLIDAVEHTKTWRSASSQPATNPNPASNVISDDPRRLSPDPPSGNRPAYATLAAWVPPSSESAGHDGASDWFAWFGAQLVHLLAAVKEWQGALFYADGLQAFLHQEIMMFEAREPTRSEERLMYALSRRQALITLAALPLAMASSPAATPRKPVATDAFLAECAASLTACWHLLRGVDLSLVHQILSAYLVPLGSMAQLSSQHQPTAARLASQAHRICGIVALHRNELKVRERHCQQAVQYANIANDASAHVSALVSLASTHFYANNPKQAAAVYERALVHEHEISSLQRSRVHAELSVVYGQLWREQEALSCLGAAEDLYPNEPEQDRSFLYAEFTPASFALERGLAYLALAHNYSGRGYERRAMDTFDRVQATSAAAIPDRIRFEIVNHQAATSILLNDLDAFDTYIASGVEGVRRLQSKQRQQEALTAWRLALSTWPHEQRLKTVADRFPLLLNESAS